MKTDKDIRRRFIFEEKQIRGEIVILNKSLEKAFSQHNYDASTKILLGQNFAAVSLLSSLIKFEGRLTLQLQSDGALKLLLAQINHKREFRGLALTNTPLETPALEENIKNGRLLMSVQRHEKQPYQAIVEVDQSTLAQCLENYFERSEQLKTRLFLFANETHAAGLLLQAMPEMEQSDNDYWEHLTILAETLSEQEALSLSQPEILKRLFHQESLRMFDAETVKFHCGCSREHIASAIQTLGVEEVMQIIEEQGKIEASCDFCNKSYQFSKNEVTFIFSDTSEKPSDTIH